MQVNLKNDTLSKSKIYCINIYSILTDNFILLCLHRTHAVYQTCHVTYQLKISSTKFLLARPIKEMDSGYLMGQPSTNPWRKRSRDKLCFLQGFQVNCPLKFSANFVWPQINSHCYHRYINSRRRYSHAYIRLLDPSCFIRLKCQKYSSFNLH